MSERFVVTVTRIGMNSEAEITCELAVIGTYRSRERAEKRAATIRKQADTYEDPEGVTGPDNALDVVVEPIHAGTLSAEYTLDLLYGGR